MRTSMFSQAAEHAGEVLVVVVGPEVSTPVQDRPFRSDTKAVRVNEGTDTRLWLITRSLPASARPDLLTGYGRPLTSLPLSAATVAGVVQHLTAFKPDLIILSRAYLLPILDAFDEALADIPLLVDLDDDDAEFCRSLAACQHGAGSEDDAAWQQAQADVYDKLISRHADAVDLFAAASANVVTSIQERLSVPNITCVPNGITGAEAAPAGLQGWRARLARARQPKPCLLFVGNLGYRPNVDGMCWFLKAVWPGLREALTGINVIVAGSEPDEQLVRLCQGDGIQLVENPVDLAPLYQRADAAIIPLRFGSGSRIKILEAGCHGVPVISTFAGAEGLDVDPSKHAFLCDETADGFARACLDCLGNSQAAQTRAAALKAFVRQHHDRHQIISDLHVTLRSLLDG